jgi:hypothetical protein
MAKWAEEGVDEEMQGVIEYAGGGRLSFTCGFGRSYDTFTRVLGIDGEVRLTNPFHPHADDVMEIREGNGSVHSEPSRQDKPSFTPALESIQEAIRGEAPPEHLAVDEAMGTAIGLELALEAAKPTRRITEITVP